VRQEALAQCLSARQAVVALHRRRDHVSVEDPLGGVDCRQLELLLRPEVRVEAALAHPDRPGEAADREPVDALDGREASGGVEDRAPAALAVGAAAAFGCGLERHHR
jgi:hypothetical protein